MDKQWIEIAPGRRVFRTVRTRSEGRSDLACPNLIRDFDEPVQSCADGKFYSSKAALSRSARAAHNPHGMDFIELGNEELPWVEHVPDAQKRRQDVAEAMHEVVTGNVSPEIAAIE